MRQKNQKTKIYFSLFLFSLFFSGVASAATLAKKLAGRILLQVESRGEAWYVDPVSLKRIYLADGNSAYSLMKNMGLGITNSNLEKVPVGIMTKFIDLDEDGDKISDAMEEALGTDFSNPDTDGDGYNDYEEILANYSPVGKGKMKIDKIFTNRLKGRILLQVESQGEAWYVNPVDGKRYFMKNGEAAYQIMKLLSLGIKNSELQEIEYELDALSLPYHIIYNRVDKLPEWQYLAHSFYAYDLTKQRENFLGEVISTLAEFSLVPDGSSVDLSVTKAEKGDSIFFANDNKIYKISRSNSKVYFEIFKEFTDENPKSLFLSDVDSKLVYLNAVIVPERIIKTSEKSSYNTNYKLQVKEYDFLKKNETILVDSDMVKNLCPEIICPAIYLLYYDSISRLIYFLNSSGIMIYNIQEDKMRNFSISSAISNNADTFRNLTFSPDRRHLVVVNDNGEFFIVDVLEEKVDKIESISKVGEEVGKYIYGNMLWEGSNILYFFSLEVSGPLEKLYDDSFNFIGVYSLFLKKIYLNTKTTEVVSKMTYRAFDFNISNETYNEYKQYESAYKRGLIDINALNEKRKAILGFLVGYRFENVPELIEVLPNQKIIYLKSLGKNRNERTISFVLWDIKNGKEYALPIGSIEGNFGLLK